MLLLLSVATPMSVRPTATTPGNALHLLDDHFGLRQKLRAAELVDLEDVIALVAGIDRPRVNRLPVDHRGADDEADRDRELEHDERGAQPPGARRFRRRAVGLQHLRRLEPGEEEGRDRAR